jgi:hypothetical protein
VIGTLVAQKLDVPRPIQFNRQTNNSSPNPLEVLVVQQLVRMKVEQGLLEQQYAQLGTGSDSPDGFSRFSAHLNHFGEKADRLGRLVDAMNGYC